MNNHGWFTFTRKDPTVRAIQVTEENLHLIEATPSCSVLRYGEAVVVYVENARGRLQADMGDWIARSQVNPDDVWVISAQEFPRLYTDLI